MDFKPIDAAVSIKVDPLARTLEIVGFTLVQGKQIRADGFDHMMDMNIEILEEQDIKDLAETFSRKLVGSRISFGMDHTKRLIVMMY